MGSRERKRAELQRRKERAAAQAAAPVGSTPETGAPAPEADEAAAAPPSRSEQRNEEARRALVPLAEGERPLIVTVAAVISGLLALSFISLYVIGVELKSGEKPPVVQVIVPTALMGLMAWGLWRARYWAVLGFQTLMLIVILATALGLTTATGVQIPATAVLLAVSGTLFYFMIKAMARIQMPSSGR